MGSIGGYIIAWAPHCCIGSTACSGLRCSVWPSCVVAVSASEGHRDTVSAGFRLMGSNFTLSFFSYCPFLAASFGLDWKTWLLRCWLRLVRPPFSTHVFTTEICTAHGPSQYFTEGCFTCSTWSQCCLEGSAQLLRGFPAHKQKPACVRLGAGLSPSQRSNRWGLCNDYVVLYSLLGTI